MGEVTTGLVMTLVIDGETWRSVDSEETDRCVGSEVGGTICVIGGGGMLDEEVWWFGGPGQFGFS